MSWLNLNQSLNSLKGQITNFASEVLSEGIQQESDDNPSSPDPTENDLLEKCHKQELEIAALKKLNEELEASLQSEKLSRKNGVREEEASWYWDPSPQPSKHPGEMEKHIAALQKEISTLKQRECVKQPYDEELEKLREENKNLTTNLDDLDNQHQLAMERLLTLKRELQKNFEVLKEEHEELKSSNDEYEAERQMLLSKISERDKEIEEIKTHNSDYETLHHKYLNLEKIHSLLRENAEKFQEENQELHEEIFKLQEQVTKYEHELEISTKHSELSNMVPRENYEAILNELNELKDQRKSNKDNFEETNIDDNAKSVIESLKRDIRELKHKLSQKDNDVKYADENYIHSDKIVQLYNKYVNFELPVDFIGEMPSSDDIVLFKLESSFKTLNSFKKHIDSLEHSLAEKKHDVNEMEVQIFDLTNENDFLSADVLQFRSELKEMKKNNDFLINEIAALKNTSKLEPIMETHEENVAKLESELDDCTKMNKNFESEIKRIEKELDEVQSEKVVLRNSLKEMREKYTTLSNEFESIKTQSKAVEELENGNRAENTNKLKRAVDEIDELKKKITALNTKNEQLSIDIHIIENDKVLLTKEIDDMKQVLANAFLARNSLQDVNIDLDDKLKNLHMELDELTKNNTKLEGHKRKLEADLSILKNKVQANDALSVEIQKVTSENQKLSDNLNQAQLERNVLTDTVEKLTAEIVNLNQREINLKEENELLKNITVTDDQTTKALKETLKANVLLQETQNKEISSLKEENQNLLTKKLQLEAELTSTDSKITHLEEEFEKLVTDLSDKDTIIDNLNSTLTENVNTINNLNDTISGLNKTIQIKNEELQRLSHALNESNSKLNEISTKLNETSTKSDKIFEELKQLGIEKAELSNQILNLHEEIEIKNSIISQSTNRSEELQKQCDKYKATILDKDKEIRELNQSIVKFTDKVKICDNYSHLKDEFVNLVKDKENLEQEVTDLKNNVYTKENEITEVKSKTDHLETTVFELRNAMENATKEKNELINLITIKHNESVQYHTEIQRLNHVLLEQTNEFKRVVEEKDNLIQNKSDCCANCENLRRTLKEKDEIILTLNKNTTELERLKEELSQANDTVKSLKERCENLDKSLAIQLDSVKRLTAEHLQLSEKEQNSTRELERLRHHLVETEENYTQELMASEQKLNECQARLHQVEDRAKQTSTVYTSNSIRANQEVETLRNQIKLLEKQREEVQIRLSEAEDAKNRCEAGLTNLQVVLEQFQLEKEREIETATEKIRNKMVEVEHQSAAYQDEISRLNMKLEESLVGLQAACRLGDQVESKSAVINDLREQVRALQATVAAAEERYHNATSNQQDKVDKNLVKNLIINYVVTAAQSATSKAQVLRVLSTVLDFNQQECEKLGLVRSSNPPDSLAAEFIKFLQNESKPRTPLPNMMGIAQGPSRSATPVSRRNSTLGPNPVIELGHQRNPSTGSNNLLFQNLDSVETSSQVSIESDSTKRTLETGITQTRDTEGAILKHVLRDM